jgi:hypothetical protein
MYTNTIVCIQNLVATMRKHDIKIWFEHNQPTMEQAQSLLLSTWMGGNVTFNDYFLLLRPDMYFTEQDIANMINLQGEAVFANFAKSNGSSSAIPVKNVPTGLKDNQTLEYLTAPLGCILLRKNVVTKIQKLLIKENHSLSVLMAPDNQEIIPFFKHRLINRSENQNNSKASSVWMDDSFSFSWLIRQAGVPITGYQSTTLGRIMAVSEARRCRHSEGFEGYKNPPLKKVVNVASARSHEPSRERPRMTEIPPGPPELHPRMVEVVDKAPEQREFMAPMFHPRIGDMVEKPSEKLPEKRKYMAPMLHPRSIEELHIQDN